MAKDKALPIVVKKPKIGKQYRFQFAGLEYQGELFSIDETIVGTVEHKWFKCRHKDGTIYPIQHHDLREINK